MNKTITDAMPTSSNLITLKCVLSFLIRILVIGIPGVVEFDNTLALGNTHTHTRFSMEFVLIAVELIYNIVLVSQLVRVTVK